jgi:3-oxoacyl-[acyl-carrier protein] reductase
VHFSSPGDIIYAMSKAAVEAFTRHAAESLAGKGIRINAVIPGFTDNGHPAFQDPAIRAYLGEFSVLGDVAAADDVAEAIAFLISERSRRTTGAMLDVSAGSTLGARASSAGKLSLRTVADSTPD